MIYYVSNTGSDSNDGSVGSPFLTVQHAISVSSNTDTINILNEIQTSTTITVNKEITITGTGPLIKTTAGDLFLIQSSNVTITMLTMQANATNTADSIINIDRGSIGYTLPSNYSNINITENAFYVWKYAIVTNGTNINISYNTFYRSSGSTERTSIIIAYHVNGLTIDNNNVIDTLRVQRFLYLTSAGDSGAPYFTECNAKTGLITVSNNICDCSSTAQGLIFIIQDEFTGISTLSFDVFSNSLINLGIAGKLFVFYISYYLSLVDVTNVSVHSNSISLSTSGIVHLDAVVPVALPTDQKFNVYDNTNSNFTLDPARTGNANFTQTTATVFPEDLYLSSIVSYTAQGGGDPHIMSVFGVKTTLPNSWEYFILYKSSDLLVTAKAEFINGWLSYNKLHYMVDSMVGNFITNGHSDGMPIVHEIDPEKQRWVTNLTYITEVIFERNNRLLVFDTIEGFVKYDNSDITYKKINKPIKSLTHNIYYPPRNLISFEIDVIDTITISVDNYWDDINYITLKTNSDMYDKSGELFFHSDDNLLLTKLN